MAFTRHAVIRAQQRGITQAQIDAVLKNADRETPRGTGCAAIWISRRELQRIGPKTPEGIPTDRLRGLIILQSDNETSITAFRNQRGCKYRRNFV